MLKQYVAEIKVNNKYYTFCTCAFIYSAVITPSSVDYIMIHYDAYKTEFFATTSWACEIICLISYKDQICLAWNFRGMPEQLGHTLFRNRVKIKQVWICSATVGRNIWVTCLLWREFCHNLRVNRGLFSVSVWEVTFSFHLKQCSYLHTQKTPNPKTKKIRQNKKSQSLANY